MKQIKAIAIISTLIFSLPLFPAQIQSPGEFLGFEIGTPRKLADMDQIIAYFRMLDQASPRIQVTNLGKTTMGNPFIAAIISSEDNIKNLAAYRTYQQLLADPRKIDDRKAEEIIEKAKTIVMINCSIHATEIGASQMSLQLAHDLATDNDSFTHNILNNVIIVMIPMHNPDGIQMVVDWYNKYVGTTYEGGRMPWLYHKYVGHDNNRDWYMFTQKETRLTIHIHNQWHPQIILDMHQMGGRGARLFVPPYIDPYEPNVDPILRQQASTLGTFIASELTAENKGGVIHSIWFDAWTPARAYHHYHGGIRILTEAASAKVATPIHVDFEKLSDLVKKPSVKMPLPWKGGQWGLKDIIEYDYSAARAVLGHAAGLRTHWLRNFYRIHRKAVSPKTKPFAFIIPRWQVHVPAAIKLLQILHMGGVEIHQAGSPFQADGKSYPSGTYVIFMAQPYGSYAKALLEKQKYPEIREYASGPLKTPYDAAAHTLPLLMDVDVETIKEPFTMDGVQLQIIKKPAGTLQTLAQAAGYIWGHATTDDFVALNRLLQDRARIFWTTLPNHANGRTYAEGSMVVKNSGGIPNRLKHLAGELSIRFDPLEKLPAGPAYQIKPSRLAMYKSWTSSMDEGWTRWVLEQYEFPLHSLTNREVLAGNLNRKFDVIIIPDMRPSGIKKGISAGLIPVPYSGGWGEKGIANIKNFVRKGGTLITVNSSCMLPIEEFNLGIKNVVQGLKRDQFFVPGSILRVLNKPNHPLCYGFENRGEILFRRSPVFAVQQGLAPVKYPLDNPLLSGWITGPKHLLNRSAVAEVPLGKGKIILFAFPVAYRGQAHQTFRYLFNAIHYGPAQLTQLK